MEILEAYQSVPPTGGLVRIYEFRGRVYKQVETTEAGQTVIVTKKGKQHPVRVAAENLYDAAAHLRIYRPDFFSTRVLCLGHMRLSWRVSTPPPADLAQFASKHLFIFSRRLLKVLAG